LLELLSGPLYFYQKDIKDKLIKKELPNANIKLFGKEEKLISQISIVKERDIFRFSTPTPTGQNLQQWADDTKEIVDILLMNKLLDTNFVLEVEGYVDTEEIGEISHFLVAQSNNGEIKIAFDDYVFEPRMENSFGTARLPHRVNFYIEIDGF